LEKKFLAETDIIPYGLPDDVFAMDVFFSEPLAAPP